MTTGIEYLKLEKKKTTRGPAKKKERLVCTSLRLPVEVMEYFADKYPYTKQSEMRKVLIEHVNNQTGANHE